MEPTHPVEPPANAPAPRFLKLATGNIVLPYTPQLAERGDVVECDPIGNPLPPPTVQLPVHPPAGDTPPAAPDAAGQPPEAPESTLPPAEGQGDPTPAASPAKRPKGSAKRPKGSAKKAEGAKHQG